MKGLDGRVALVTGGGSEVGRAIALALAARGVKVVVTGRNERALGETVGEIAYGGGKARHVVADVRNGAEFAVAAERAIEVFGGLDIVVVNAEGPEELGAHQVAFEAGAQRGISRLLATVSASSSEQGEIVGLVRKAAPGLFARHATSNAIVWDDTDDVGAVAASLCSAAGEGITGQAIWVGSGSRFAIG